MSSYAVPTATIDDVTSAVVLLDVREQYEWDAGHAPDALHIPMGDVPARFGELPEGADVLVVCHIGGRSAEVTAWLVNQGYACRNLAGGMVAYAAAGLPMESENGQPPRAE
jgi:rhodanese-related sulfurtransferase